MAAGSECRVDLLGNEHGASREPLLRVNLAGSLGAEMLRVLLGSQGSRLVEDGLAVVGRGKDVFARHNGAGTMHVSLGKSWPGCKRGWVLDQNVALAVRPACEVSQPRENRHGSLGTDCNTHVTAVAAWTSSWEPSLRRISLMPSEMVMIGEVPETMEASVELSVFPFPFSSLAASWEEWRDETDRRTPPPPPWTEAGDTVSRRDRME
ncbi:hypothetical protein GQ53DRAFT_402855 [Thozetella sp. PMI_491]|nr:hypothetical protein GQ53DRAFT_402855 [Thozetella sp. PMI_491]